jgi:DNA-binding NarL/FixJ family response regulator
LDLGLAAAVEWQVQEFQDRTGIRCQLRLPAQEVVAPNVSTALFRILQETFTNVARHAGATRAEVVLQKERDRLVLAIRDNGRGFDQADPSLSGSLGLVGMQERAAMLGGGVSISSAPRKGTSVIAWIPLRPPEDRRHAMMRILIVDDHDSPARRTRCSPCLPRGRLGEASDAEQALEQQEKGGMSRCRRHPAGKSGCSIAAWPAPVLVLSVHPEDQFAVRALKAGAEGYMTKESAPEELVEAIRKILAGGRYVSPTLAEKLAVNVSRDFTRAPHETLSDREYEVMCQIASGKTVTGIAEELSLSVKTISTYRARILEKLGVKNSAEITQYAIRNNLVS